MLVLKRLAGQAVRIGEHITVTVASVEGGRVMLLIDAPREVPVLREELITRRKSAQPEEVQK